MKTYRKYEREKNDEKKNYILSETAGVQAFFLILVRTQITI